MKFLKKIMTSFFIWFSAALFFFLVRIYGNEELPAFDRAIDFEWSRFMVEMIIFGFSVGIPFALVDHLYDNPLIKKKPYWMIIGFQTVVQVIIGLMSLIVLALFARTLFNELSGQRIFQNPMLFVQSKTGFLWITYIAVINFIIYVYKVLRTKIGSNVFANLLLGKYHFPSEESRIFMFIDMKDSTTHGENLGHIKFSALIQDCFNDLTHSILKHHVAVYQYVGDEAVLTWKVDKGLQNLNCLSPYFSFIDTLQSRGNHYISSYGFLPFFKAATHIGPVTVAEVGIVKREIAYHSDVLNTTSRMQGKCNELKSPLLISQDLRDKLSQDGYYRYQPVGSLFLKGKSVAVNLFRVEHPHMNESVFQYH